MKDGYEQNSADDDGFELDGFPTDADPDGRRARLPIEILATDFMEAHRNGEEPSVDEWAEKYARLADEIREFFPMLIAMEELKTDKEVSVLRNQMPGELHFETLGAYRIVREIGRGGMGVVLEGYDDERQHRVAIKVLPWRFSGVPRWRERFEREAKLAAALHHRNIVPIIGFREQDGYCYYLMHYVDAIGVDWVIQRLCEDSQLVFSNEIRRFNNRRFEQNPVAKDPRGQITRTSWVMFARIALQVAQALRYAHEQDTLHNDIKPGNLLLDARGKVWVADFGLARLLETENPAASQDPKRLTGTLRYMAPERFRGEADKRSDLYSLGMTLYELSTLTAVFDASDNKKLIKRILDNSPLPPRMVEPQIPPALEAIILKAIRKDPKQRYQTAGAMASDLLRFIKGNAVTANRWRFLTRWFGK